MRILFLFQTFDHADKYINNDSIFNDDYELYNW